MKMTWWTRCLMAGALAVSLVDVANAQQPGGGRTNRGGGGVFIGGGINFGGRGGGNNLLSLADNEAVQKELGIDENAKEDVKKINETYREELQKAIEEATKSVNAKLAPQVKGALSAEQYKRLQEIRVQALRDQAYSDPEVIKTLGLKKDQQDKIAETIKESGEKQRALFSGPGGGEGGRPDFTAMRSKMEEISKDRDAKINDILTKDQQDKFAALKGKEFDLAQLQPRGFGGPGGPGGGGPGGGRPGAGGRPKAATPPVD